jgi:hypothetical protein
LEERARAIEMRWRWPAGEFVRVLLLVQGREAHVGEELAHALADRVVALDEVVRADRLGDDLLHAPAGIQARVRVLEDHLEAPAHRQHVVAARDRAEVGAAEHHATASRSVQAADEARDGRLAAARLAHQRQGLAAVDGERHAVDRLQDLPGRALDHAIEPRARDVEVLGEALDFEQDLSHAPLPRSGPCLRRAPFDLGRAASRRRA